jgi:hypothetical protein
MKLDKVTITGADNAVDQAELIRLQEKYPFLEWGILFNTSKEGQSRYPDYEWIDSFCRTPGSRSAHFCGYYSKSVLEKQNFDLLQLAISRKFQRIQLNYNFSHGGTWRLQPLWDWCYSHPEIKIILLWNKSNHAAIMTYCNSGMPENINLLYDSSGGRGRVIEKIQSPFSCYTGYSGGLAPHNLKSFLEGVKNHQGHEDVSVWCDMETGVRTNGEFDLVKVEEVLKITSEYIE